MKKRFKKDMQTQELAHKGGKLNIPSFPHTVDSGGMYLIT